MRTLRIALASLLLVVAGCTTAESGVPTPGAGPATSAAQGSSPGSTQRPPPSQGPKRPKDIDLKKVNVCKAVVKIPLHRFGLNTNRPPLAGTSTAFPGSKYCYVGGDDTNRSLLVIDVVNMGADEFLDGVTKGVSDFDAQGYPMHLVKLTRNKNCLGVLDVHDGQFVSISFGMQDETEKPTTPQAIACQTVPKIAAAMVAALG
jgi:hypothetical protein